MELPIFGEIASTFASLRFEELRVDFWQIGIGNGMSRDYLLDMSRMKLVQLDTHCS
jgi:hypothetical protein